MKNTKFTLLAALGFALAFIFSCTVNDDGGSESPDGLTPIVGGSSSSGGGGKGVPFNENSQIYKDALYRDGDCDCASDVRSSIGVHYTGSGIIEAGYYRVGNGYIRVGSVTNGIVKLELPPTIPDEFFVDSFLDLEEDEQRDCTSYPKNMKSYAGGSFELTNSDGEDISIIIHYSDGQIWERIEYVYFSEAGKIACHFQYGSGPKGGESTLNIDAKKGWNRLYYRRVFNKDGTTTYERSTNNILTKEGQLKWLIWTEH